MERAAVAVPCGKNLRLQNSGSWYVRISQLKVAKIQMEGWQKFLRRIAATETTKFGEENFGSHAGTGSRTALTSLSNRHNLEEPIAPSKCRVYGT